MKFKDSPPGRKQKYDWEDKARQLRERPGEWGIVVKHGDAPTRKAAQSATQYIKNGSPHMPKGEFEATTVGDEVYARYVGNPHTKEE